MAKDVSISGRRHCQGIVRKVATASVLDRAEIASFCNMEGSTERLTRVYAATGVPFSNFLFYLLVYSRRNLDTSGITRRTSIKYCHHRKVYIRSGYILPTRRREGFSWKVCVYG